MSDFSWKVELDLLPDDISKLLYIVYKLTQMKEITEKHKIILKKYILQNNKLLLAQLKNLLETNDLDTFISNIKLIFLDDINSSSKSIIFCALLKALRLPDNEKITKNGK